MYFSEYTLYSSKKRKHKQRTMGAKKLKILAKWCLGWEMVHSLVLRARRSWQRWEGRGWTQRDGSGVLVGGEEWELGVRGVCGQGWEGRVFGKISKVDWFCVMVRPRVWWAEVKKGEGHWSSRTQGIKKSTGCGVGVACRQWHKSVVDRAQSPKEGNDSVIKVCTHVAARKKPKLSCLKRKWEFIIGH